MSSLLVLRSCLSLGKFGYTTRTTDLTSHGAAMSKFDGIQRDALTAIIGTPLNNQSNQQSCIPVSLGGLGVQQSQDHATSAFCASVIGSVKLITRIIGGAVTRLGAVTRPCSLRRLSPVTRSGARTRTRLPTDPRSGWWLGSWHRSVN